MTGKPRQEPGPGEYLRITVSIGPASRPRLARLMAVLHLTQSGAICRALAVCALIVQRDGEGYEVVFRHRETGQERVVELL